ncbi:MAG: hypothetical protein FWF06_00595 [Symbiobacteriaceae bacterium]|nr:hypothetical protein [Symbiobacteriaceae bacterium]
MAERDSGTMQVFFPQDLPDDTVNITFVVVAAEIEGSWLYVWREGSEGYELPSFVLEFNESPFEAATRGLEIETGANEYSLRLVCLLEITSPNLPSQYGELYYAHLLGIDDEVIYTTGRKGFFQELPDPLRHPHMQVPILARAQECLIEGSSKV